MMQKLKLAKSTGSDGISNKLYSLASAYLAELLASIINTSITHCCVPSLLKIADICVIPKSNPPSINELRPISLLCVPNQLLEKHVFTHMKDAIIQHIDKTQFGYITGSSATCALIKVQNTIINILDDKNTDGCVLLCFDFSKAFDNHKTLIAKLMSLGFPA